MGFLLSGIALFIGVHLVPTNAYLRSLVVGLLGEVIYKILFSVISLIGLYLMIIGYRNAPWIELWETPFWMRHVALIFMLPVFPLIIEAYLPGQLRAKFPHPMLLAIKIWAFSHLLTRGDAASGLLFGSFLVWAIYARISVRHRDALSGRRLVTGPQRNDWFALVVGLMIYGYFVLGGGHAGLVGVHLAAISL